jgi:peptidoglycan/xylan/chitin deacetylase (PgdA/CDA1 family)
MKPPAILAYHFIDPPPPGEAKPGLYIEPGEFERQVVRLLDAGVHFASFGEWLAGPLPERSVILTFDDGEMSFWRNATPILRKYGLQATVYPVTGEIGKTGQVWSQSRSKRTLDLMDREQIRSLSEQGIEFGSHFTRHVRAAHLRDTELREELARSKEVLEGITGCGVVSVAYPYGSVDKRTAAAARSAGYRFGLTITPGFNRFADPFLLRRWPVKSRFLFELWLRWRGWTG